MRIHAETNDKNMRTYKQTVKFERHFEIEAKDAEAANEKLAELVREIEWDADVNCEGFYDFEDDPVECPECKGECEVDDKTCPLCNGNGCVPFVA